MFRFEGQSGGVFDSWIERWRSFRKVDRWPIVNGEVIHTQYVDSGEGGSYKLTAKYRVPSSDHERQVLSVVTLWSDTDANIGDIIELRAHPDKPMKAVFADTSQSAGHLMIWTVFIAIVLFVLTIRGCNAFFNNPH